MRIGWKGKCVFQGALLDVIVLCSFLGGNIELSHTIQSLVPCFPPLPRLRIRDLKLFTNLVSSMAINRW